MKRTGLIRTGHISLFRLRTPCSGSHNEFSLKNSEIEGGRRGQERGELGRKAKEDREER